MSKITALGTAVPRYRHEQQDIMRFMQKVYALPEAEQRKLRYLYAHSGIDIRYSVIGDYSRPVQEWKFYPQSENLEPFPSLETRMHWYNRLAAPLSVDAIRKCLEQQPSARVTHLITASCTGMSAPGLDLQIMDLMDLPRNIHRSSVNFMGCYAAIHAMKMADAICRSDKEAGVLVVCTELCTLHFQKGSTFDSVASALLFGDGAAALFMTSRDKPGRGVCLDQFYSEVIPRGKNDMSWELSSTGFVMSLSNYVPDLIGEDIEGLTNRAIKHAGLQISDIHHWCIHPGGKRILEAIQTSLDLKPAELEPSYQVLRHFGNMSSPSILFVLKDILSRLTHEQPSNIFGMAFGPGLTMETFLASTTA